MFIIRACFKITPHISVFIHRAWSWELAAVEPPTCPGKGHEEPARDPETPQAEPIPVFNAQLRAARAPMFCSISVSFTVKLPIELLIAVTWESIWDIHFVRTWSCASCVSSCANFERISLSFFTQCCWSGRPFSRRHHEIQKTTHWKGCRQRYRAKPEELVTQETHAHVRTGNGLSENGYGSLSGLERHEFLIFDHAERTLPA